MQGGARSHRTESETDDTADTVKNRRRSEATL
jgi:hypothetical protein